MDVIDDLTYEQNVLKAAKVRKAAADLQAAKLKALQDSLGSYGDLSYVDFGDFIDPDNQNWQDYTYRLPSFMVSPTESAKRYGHINAGTPVGMFIQQIRDAKNTDDVAKQLETWNSYKPLDSYDNGRSYIRYFIPGFATRHFDYGGSKPEFPTTDGSNTVQTGTGGAQGAQAGNTGGGTPSTQDAKTGGTGTGSTGGSTQTGNSGGYASPGVPRGGTKAMGYGYNPNPDNVSLAYTLRNEPDQVQRAALSAKWNLENGRSGSTYATPGMNTGGTYATGQGIKDANGNVLTNPGGDWEYQYALKNPQYGLGMMGKMSDAQKNYLQAVSDNMGYKYNFTGATRFV